MLFVGKIQRLEKNCIRDPYTLMKMLGGHFRLMTLS